MVGSRAGAPRGRIEAATDATVREAAELLRAGEIVGMPTETVYGLAADALNEQAVGKVFAAKGRPADHPLIVHLPSAQHLPRWARSIPREVIALADAFWPGPLTVILPRSDDVPDAVTGGQDTVGVRVPAHPVARALLHVFDSGIAAPSANRFGRISPTRAIDVQTELGERVAMILDGGPCEVGIESTIIDFSRGVPEILRPGGVSATDIARVIGRAPRENASPEADAPRVSGALAAHYAPITPLYLIDAAALSAEALARAAVGLRVAVMAHSCANPHDSRVMWQAMPADPVAYARALYACLRATDALAADCILVEQPPLTPPWHAVIDRLGRAATGSGSDPA